MKPIFQLTSNINNRVKLLLFLLYFSSIFIANYILLSDRNYLEQSFQSVKASERNEQAERMVEAGIDYISNNTMIRILYALQGVVKSTYSIGMLAFLLWLTLAFITDYWNSFLNIFYSLSLASSILTFGIMLDTAVKLLCYNYVSYFEFGVLFNYFDLHRILKILSLGFHLFTVLFLVTLSVSLSQYFKEKILTILLLSTMCWLFIILLSYFLGFNVSLTA
ncbi:MAG: hypothetical protein QME58_09050 [Bacteroidota bacterium]|nr:hypothetical protein [Bacteroidota bacterium]